MTHHDRGAHRLASRLSGSSLVLYQYGGAGIPHCPACTTRAPSLGRVAGIRMRPAVGPTDRSEDLKDRADRSQTLEISSVRRRDSRTARDEAEPRDDTEGIPWAARNTGTTWCARMKMDSEPEPSSSRKKPRRPDQSRQRPPAQTPRRPPPREAAPRMKYEFSTSFSSVDT